MEACMGESTLSAAGCLSTQDVESAITKNKTVNRVAIDGIFMAFELFSKLKICLLNVCVEG
jgi:hypothetical protein